MEWFLVWTVLSALVGAWAASRGHSAVGMFLVSFLLSPLIGFLVEAIRGRDIRAAEHEAIASGTMKKCPACAELVRLEATKCRYCGEPLPIPTTTSADTDDDGSGGPAAFGG